MVSINLYFQSECLKDAFQELDMTSEVLEILMSPDKPYFRMSTFGNAGSAYVSKNRPSFVRKIVVTICLKVHLYW